MAAIYSYDLDQEGSVDGVTDLQATISQRVVDASNALAGAAVPTIEQLFPAGPNTANTWTVSRVYKHYQDGPNEWDSLITGCALPTAPSSQTIQVQFTAIGVGGGPYVITRSVNPGGCVALNLPATSALPDGVYAVTATAPQGSFGSALSYSTTGRRAQLSNGVSSGPAVLNGTVVMEGRAADHVLLEVTLYLPAGSQPFAILSATTDGSGSFAILGLPTGTYDVKVKHRQFLSRIAPSRGLASGSNPSISFGLLLAGDVNDSDAVTLSDYAILRGTFGKCTTDPGFDARADLNGSGCVTLGDYALLRANFGKVGPLAT